MVKKIDFKKIMPFVNSIEEMKEIYYSFPNYKEKIEKFGIVAFYLK
jgi:ASC-1-like (ASCH) protein